MKMWDKVNVGFNVDEETANFGTRACAVNDVAVYETNTLAAIHAGEEKPTGLPNVHSQFFPQVGLCVAVDSSLTIFNEDCSTVKCIITLKSGIEAFVVSPCGLFVFIGTDGQVKCFHIESTGIEVFTRTVYSTSCFTNIVTMDCYAQNDEVHVVLMLTTGQLFKSSEIRLTKVKNACSLKDYSAIEECNQNVTFDEAYYDKQKNSQVLTGISLLKEKDSLFLVTSQNMSILHMEDLDQAFSGLLDGYSIVKIGGIVNNSVLLTLCDSKCILQICLYTMTPYFMWTEFPVNDFVVLEGNTIYDCNILALVGDGVKGQALVLISWPDFQIKYRLPVEDTSFLIHQKGSEEILFLEGHGDDGIDTVRVKAVVESQPDLRLERILRRCKFEEAEKFAKAFSLDLDIVYKSHVQKLSQELSPWSLSVDSQKEIFNKILNLIKKIKDHRFVAEICVSAIPPDFVMLHTMLMYGMERFSKVTDKSQMDLSDLLGNVSTIARRLDTCMLIYGSATTVDHWIEFPKYDLVISCLNHIRRGEIKESVLIWSRHLSDTKTVLTVDKAKQLLAAIPQAIKLQDLLFWVQHFVPAILMLFPHILADVIPWIIQRVRNFEILDFESWPSSGLTLAKCLLHLVHTSHTEKNILLQSKRVVLRNENLSQQSPLNQLLQLIDILQDISMLKENYDVVIQYDQFVQDDHESFVAALLERLPLEKISPFMDEFFHKIIMERGLNPDNQILQFIQDIVMNCEDWWFWDEAPWEARVSCLIPHINNIQIKLDAILHVLRSAPVPWTSTISHLADQGIRLPHYKASDVRNECNNIPKRLIMKKYGIMINKNCEMQLVRLILKKNKNNMLEDIKELAKCVKEKVSDIYLIAMIHLIENGEENMVWEMLKTEDVEQRTECLSQLILHMHRLLAHSTSEKLPAYFRFMPTLDNIAEKDFFSELKNIYFLKIEFNITTTLDIMSIHMERQKILGRYADKLAKELLAGSTTENIAVMKIRRLAYLLHITGEEGVIVLSNLCVKHNMQLALIVSSLIGDVEGKPSDVFNKLSVLIGQLTAFYKPAESHSSLIELFRNITSKIAKHFLTYCANYSLNNIFQWISLLNHNSIYSKSILKTVYGDPAPTAATAMLIHNCVQSVVYSFVKSLEYHGKPFNGSINSVLPLTSEIPYENHKIMVAWQRLKEEQQYLLCVRLVCEYCWSQKIVNPEFQENNAIDMFLTQCIKDLLRKLFRLRNLDLELALSLLHFFNEDEAMNFLLEESQSVGYNYQRLSPISLLTLSYCTVRKIDKYKKNFRKHYVSCKWAKKLNELSLSYKDAFKSTDTEHRQLILKLITLPSATLPLLEEFCIDMCYDQQECLMLYLEHLLLNWKPDIQITEEASSGTKVMVVKNSRYELLQQCRALLHKLGTKTAKSELVTMSWSESIQNDLYNLWNKVNYYYYEVYFVLADLYQRVLAHQSLVQQISSHQTMLEFLQTYTRISSPSEAEQEQWFQLFPNTNQLPPISNFRLPFTPFFAKEPPWGILKPELSLKTYKIWYDILPNLGLDRNMLCTLTIQRLTSDQLAGGIKDKRSWRLQACNNSVLQEIQECVRNIQNQEMASAALYFVVNHMPPGADQVTAANLCYQQAEYWMNQENSEKARAGFAKVQKKYLTVCTSHILHMSGLGKQEYLQLVLHPQELITSLYYDPSILQHKSGTLSHCPDINKVVMDIGKLHRLNVLGVQQELLSEWLYPPDSPPLDMSCDDITQNIAAIHSTPVVSTDNDTVVRACYVLESMDIETAAKYLISYIGIRDEMECRPTAVRLRALQCLCSIASPEVIMKTTGRTLENIKENMQNLMFISELEKLGLVWSSKGFETCDKEDILRMLLLKTSPHAIQLAAAVGWIFKLTNTENWNKILQYMTSYNMVDELAVILPELTSMCHLLNSEIFIASWNCALITPLQKAENPLNEECSQQVKRSLELLYCCPVPRKVDLALMLNHCQRLHNSEAVGRLQPFLSLTKANQELIPIKQENTIIKQEPFK